MSKDNDIPVEKIGDRLLPIRVRNALASNVLTKVMSDLQISPEHLGQEFVDQSATYFRYCYLRERAKAHRDEVKFELDLLEAQLEYKAREKYKGSTGRVTDAFVKSIVKKQTAWIDQNRQHLEAKFVSDTLEAVARAFEQRANMLSMLGAHMRYEIEQSMKELKRK